MKIRNGIKIVAYEAQYKQGVDLMLASIEMEFEKPIRTPLKKEKIVLPNPYWVALKGEEIVGTVALILKSPQIAILKNMMVRQDVRGSKIGLSQNLLNIALDYCRSKAIKKIYLGTMAQFKAAQKFYQKNGFNEILEHELPENFLINPLDTVFFIKKLAIT